MGIARRQFLQAGLTSLIGWQFLTRNHVALAAEQYVRQAKPAQRKRALLIGINQYDVKEERNPPNVAAGWMPLRGCINDVELQKELLIHRFGFAAQDIVTLTDRSATKSNIANAITEHLVAQTLPDDLVVVHFSGHGSRLGNYNTLVPVDSGLPLNPDTLQDITEQEWQSWLQAIATDRILNVIDAGFYYPNLSTVGNFRLRSRIGLKTWQPSTEIETNENSSRGTTLRATTGEMLCAEAQWSGFSCGAFTYALVQQLWQIIPATTLHIVMSDVATILDRRALHNDSLTIDKQVASMWADEAKQKSSASDTFANLPVPDITSDGVITSTGDQFTADVYLAGLPISVLSNYAAGSILNAITIDHVIDVPNIPESNIPESIDANAPVVKNIPKAIAKNIAKVKATVQLKSRNGFTGKVEVLGDRSNSKSSLKLETGQLLQEVMRAISRNVQLAIALDTGLSRIERVDATSAFSILPNMFSVNADEQCADCIFGVQSASYGLFTVGHTPILGSFGSVGESVGVAIKRLQSFLEALLAAKLIRTTENQATSHLDARVTLKAIVGVDERSVVIASRESTRASMIPTDSKISNTIRTKPINIGDRLECQIENFSDEPLYMRIFCLDPRSKMLTPNFIAPPYASDSIIPPLETLTIPYAKAPMNWTVSAPKGMVDVQVVISRSPLLKVTKALDVIQRQASSVNGLISIPNPLQVAQALLADLDQSGKPSELGNAVNVNDTWMLDVNHWATFSFNYQVV